MTDRAPRESLADMLTVERLVGGAYRASLESFWGSTTRGDLAARCVLVAMDGRTHPPHAVQASFTGQAPPDVTIALIREDIGADRARVRVSHEGELVADVGVRFGPTNDGLTYQSVAPDSGLPAPEDLPSEREQGEAEGWAPFAVGPIESRRIGVYEPVKDDEPAVWLGWLRPRQALPDSAPMRAAALAFLGEYRSHWAVERRLGADFPSSEITLLDHALWVHRPERWDDFWLVKTLTDVGVGGRCLSRREIYTRDGTLVASAVWEARVRKR